MSQATQKRLSIDEAGVALVEPSTYTDESLVQAACKVLRDEAPIHFVEHSEYPPVWILTRHQDIVEIERHTETWLQGSPNFLMSYAQMSAVQSMDFPYIRTMLHMDGSEHRAYRKVTASWFQPRNLAKLEYRLAELARQAVDRMADLGSECDFAQDIAVPYPMQVILSILGLPDDDYPLMLRLTQQMMGNADPEFGLSSATPAENYADSIEGFYTYFIEVHRKRQSAPTDDLASAIANAQLPTQTDMPLADVIGYYMLFAVAGHDTTSSSLAGGLQALLENGEFGRLGSDSSLIPSAAEEMIRWVTPIKHFTRAAAGPYRLRDHQFHPGDRIFLAYPAANRDESAFADPSVFDLARSPNEHLSFGLGHHFCLGANLARMEVRALFRELTERLSWIEIAGEPELIASNFSGGLKHLRIRYAFK
jgi:cytochrome P450